MTNKIARFYDRIAARYDIEQRLFPMTRGVEIRLALKTVQSLIKSDYTVLEIGAGTGLFTTKIAPLAKRVVANDISPNMLRILKAKTRDFDNVHPVCGDFLQTELDGQFDMVVSFSALEYFGNTPDLFDKIGRLTRPGGHVVISTAHDTILRMVIRAANFLRQGILLRAYGKQQLRDLFSRGGFEIHRVHDFGLRFPPNPGLVLLAHGRKRETSVGPAN